MIAPGIICSVFQSEIVRSNEEARWGETSHVSSNPSSPETGNFTMTVVPLPLSLLIRISPPCFRTIQRDRVNPSPSLSGPRLE